MTEYSQPIASALRMIAKKGDACVWRHYLAVNGTEPWLEDETPAYVDYNVRIAFFPYDGGRNAGFVFQQVESDVTTFSSYGLMGVVPFAPAMRDRITRSDGQVVKPAGLGMLKPGAEIVLWQIGVVG